MKLIHALWPLWLAAVIGWRATATPVTAVVSVKSQVSMQELADEVNDPTSMRYHVFYTPEELRMIAAPTDANYSALIAQLKAEGFQVVKEAKTHLFVTVKADSSVFESVFSTQLQTNAVGEHRPLVQERVPSRLPLVDQVIGLDSTRHSVPKYIFADTSKKPTRAPKPPISGNNPAGDTAGGVAQGTIKAAYGLTQLYSQGLTGAGQHIAIATYSGFNINDIKSFYQQSNLSPGPTIDQVNVNGTAAYDANSAVETELDSEFTGMIAPGAAIHVFASATNDDTGEAAIFTAILDDNRAKIINYSWGDCETNLASAHATAMIKIFQQAVAQGVNIMNASGDNGAFACKDAKGNLVDKVASDWPGATDYVVAIGGTSFAQTSSGALNETAWSCTTFAAAGKTGCSGGGVSTMWALPSWQQGLIPSTFTMRAYPDVSFNANPQTGQDIYVSQTQTSRTGQWATIGGTSMAAPQWSGFMALVGQARANSKLAPVGFVNPLLYAAGKSNRTTMFNDITKGSNGNYSAGTGWDAVTGWGSPQFANLLPYLAK